MNVKKVSLLLILVLMVAGMAFAIEQNGVRANITNPGSSRMAEIMFYNGTSQSKTVIYELIFEIAWPQQAPKMGGNKPMQPVRSTKRGTLPNLMPGKNIPLPVPLPERGRLVDIRLIDVY